MCILLSMGPLQPHAITVPEQKATLVDASRAVVNHPSTIRLVAPDRHHLSSSSPDEHAPNPNDPAQFQRLVLRVECTPFSRTGSWVGLRTLGDELPRGAQAQA